MNFHRGFLGDIFLSSGCYSPRCFDRVCQFLEFCFEIFQISQLEKICTLRIFTFSLHFGKRQAFFFLKCILAGYHCTSIISWQYFENDILLILTWVLNQGPWYFKADALSTRPTEHGKVDESSTDKTETFVYSFRLKNEKFFNPRLRCERPRVRFL